MANQPPCAPVAPETLPAIAYQGVRVITTELLAQLYGTENHNILKNLNENHDRFTAGKHYFKLEGTDLRMFKNYITQSDVVQIPKHTRHLILWTERGAARHAKMLKTDQAWEVFEKLEDCYFGKKAANQPAPAASALPLAAAHSYRKAVPAPPAPSRYLVAISKAMELLAMQGLHIVDVHNPAALAEFIRESVPEDQLPGLLMAVAARLAGDTGPQRIERHG